MRNEENICQYCTRQREIMALSLNVCQNQMNQKLSLESNESEKVREERVSR